ncbi:SPOR domain-containing protein [Desulfocicer niacini]
MFVRAVMVSMGLFCLCGIMFFTGVMVGRETVPVHFDTRPLQKKLAELANREKRENPPEKTELAFYNELKKKVSTDFSLSQQPWEKKDAGVSGRDVPDLGGSQEPVPMKKALKARTRAVESTETELDQGLEGQGISPGSGTTPVQLQERSESKVVSRPLEGAYTIQISSFRQLLDAIKRMETLKVKGFSPHRSIALVDGNVWHRVRVGTYPDSVSAEKALKVLESRGVYGIIIQKE